MSISNPSASESKLIRIANQLRQSHRDRVCKFRKRYPTCQPLFAATSLQLLDPDIETYIEASAILVRVARVRPEEYMRSWHIILVRQPESFSSPHLSLRLSNLGVHLKRTRRYTTAHAVIKTHVLNWLIALRDESVLQMHPDGLLNVTELELLARQTLKLGFRVHIMTSLIVGLRLMGARHCGTNAFSGVLLCVPCSAEP